MGARQLVVQEAAEITVSYLQGLVVYIVYDGGQIVACGSRNNNLAGTGLNVSRSLLLGSVETGALQHYVYLQLAPGQLRSVSLCINLDLFAVYDDGVIGSGHGVSQCVLALRRIVLQQVSQHFGRSQVVDSNHFIAFCAEHLTESQTADTAETIDSNSYHLELPPKNI